MTDVAGEFQSKEAGIRASIPKLIALIGRCPGARQYYIIFIAPEGRRVDRRALVYHREDKNRGIIEYEEDVFSGGVGRTYFVDNEAIKAVEEEGGTLEDFAGYEQKARSKRMAGTAAGNLTNAYNGGREASLRVSLMVTRGPVDPNR